MVRKITSQDPIVITAQPGKTFGDMKMAKFDAKYVGTKTRVNVVMTPYDFDTDEILESAKPYSMNIPDLESQISISPKFEAAWDTINDIMGLYYDFLRLKEKVDIGIINGDDVSALIVARDAALVLIKAPVG